MKFKILTEKEGYDLLGKITGTMDDIYSLGATLGLPLGVLRSTSALLGNLKSLLNRWVPGGDNKEIKKELSSKGYDGDKLDVYFDKLKNKNFMNYNEKLSFIRLWKRNPQYTASEGELNRQMEDLYKDHTNRSGQADNPAPTPKAPAPAPAPKPK